MKPGDAAVATAQSVEMASTDPGMVALALSDEAKFTAKVKSAIALVLDVPETRITVTMISKLSLLQTQRVRAKMVEVVMWLATFPPPPPLKPPAAALATELALMVKNPNSALNGLLPQTTARLPGSKFPRPDPTSVALGSRETGMTPVEEAMKVNEETRKMVAAMRTQLQSANEARAWILSHGIPAPETRGNLPLPSKGTDPWSSMKDDSLLGKAAGAP